MQVHLRHYTAALGCVDASPASTSVVDECYDNFQRLGGEQIFCDDPYFGGDS